MDEFCGSEFWNTNLTWHTNDPDLTVCFQRTVLVWAPCLFLWIFLWLDVVRIKRAMNRDIPWGALNLSKLAFTVALIALTAVEFYIVLLHANAGGNIYPVDFYTPLIKIASFMLSGTLVYLNRKNGLQSSGLLFLFWFFLFLFSIPQCRSEFRDRTIGKENLIENYWDDYRFVSFMLFFAMTTIVFLLNCFVDKEPSYTKYPNTKNPCPEANSNFLSKLFFAWFDKMAWKGFKAPLTTTDLWDLQAENKAIEIVPAFAKHWKNAENASSVQTNKKNSVKKERRKVSILPALWKTFGGSLFFAWMLKVGYDVITFMLPQLLGLTIGFVDASKGDNRPELWKGILYASLLFIVATVQTVIFNQFFHRMYIIGFRIRTALINAIYCKSLRVSNAARKESTIGEITNLMSIDANRFTEIMLSIDLVWSAPFQISLAMYFLWSMLGPAVLAGLAVMLISMPITGLLLNVIRKYYTKQMANKDERIKMMNEILNGVKVLKLYAWENSFEGIVSNIRQKEVNTLRKSAYLGSLTNLIWFIVPYLVSLFTFGVFVLIDERNVLTPQIAFVSLNLFNIIRFPLVLLPDLVSNLIQTRVSITRIDKFLNSDELDEDSIEHSDEKGSRLLLEKVSFSWDNDGEEILKSIDMKVNNGELVAIVGSVGSGKSSLLSAVLGEMSKLSGRVHVVGKTAYVSQQAWIQNCTLRANILFGKPFDEKRYQSVIAACALEMDIGMLPAGDQTEIGEKGINLSGGQKQRISLARAVYHEADIYLLDDPLSAVDAHVGQHIFECVIGPTGLLANKTRIVVTHAVNYLPKVDKIFVLKDGTITESGDYITLLKRGGAFAEFLLEFVRDAVQDANDDEHFESQIADDTLLLERLSSRISESSQKENVVQLLRQSSESSAKNVPSESVRIQDRLIDEEELRVGSVKFEVYEHYVKSVGVKWMIFMLLANAVFQGFSIGSNMWLSRWSTDSNAGSDTHLRDTYLGVYGAFGLFMCISGFLLDLAPRLGGLVAGLRLHQTLLHGILRAPLSFFETTPTGRILSRFASDIDGIDNTLPQMLSGAFGMGFEVLATVVVISISTSWFLIAVIPIAFLYYMLQRIYIAASRQLKRLSSVTRSPIYSHFGETLQGAHTIRAFAAQKRFIEESDERVDWNQASQFANIVANRWLGIRLEIVGTLIILFAALFAVLNRDVVSSGIAGLSIAYALQITKTLNWLVRTISVVETEAVSVERVKEYSQIKSEAPWNVPSQKLANNWPEVGTVEFNDFELRYRDGLDLTLKGLSFKIDGSEKVGIVGRTGAGKSSLTLALFRIIESAGGSIVIDGQDISKLGLHDLRSRLTIIPQDPVLFSGTLRLNLDPFEQNSDEELWTALEHAHLKAFVQELTAGLNHEITEGGENLSVGQRQLICLARALLRKTKILILDEATAAIDLETDDLIQKTIRKEFNDCTILTIAHRLNTIMDSDKVIVLDQGKVLEFGSPKELLQNEMSTFYGMAKESGLV